MQLKFLALSTLAAFALAEPQATPTTSPTNLVAIISVLETALPSSLLYEAITNSAAVSREIASEFSAGETPAWWSSLPTFVKTYLRPATTTGTGAAATGSSGAMSSSSAAAMTTSSPTMTSAATSSSAMTGTTGAMSSSATTASAAATASSAGGAAIPSVVVGMGFAGLVGVAGVLAL